MIGTEEMCKLQTSSPASRPPSQIEILLLDMAKYQTESSRALEGRLIRGQLDLNQGQWELVKAQADVAYAQVR